MAAFELKPTSRGFAFGLDTEKALRTPVGIAATAPLWMAFAGAASAGVAYWWMRRFFTPTNLEAVLEAPMAPLPAPEAVEAIVGTMAAAVEPVVEVAAAFMSEPMPKPVVEAQPVVEAMPEPVVEAEPVVEPEPMVEPEPVVVALRSAMRSPAPKPAARKSPPKKPA